MREEVGFDDTSQIIAESMCERTCIIGQAAVSRPSVAPLMTDRPADVVQPRPGILQFVFHASCFKQPPGDVSVKSLFPWDRELSREGAPAAVVILCRDKPVGGFLQRRAVNVTELTHSRSESEKNLPRVERYRLDRPGVNQASLKPAARQLDRDQPIEHAARSRTQFGSLRQFSVGDESGDYVAGCFRI